jgi:predicted YcjX-like family ATPase
MDFYKLRTTEHRIAVVGLLAAGKTVFLTSLINHLKDHDPARFHLGRRNPTVRCFREIAVDDGWERFPYLSYRDSILSGQWPAKTKDRFQYACEFERTDRRFHRCKLKLYDLPGERMADAVMAIQNYAEWSDHSVGLLEGDHRYSACSLAFLGEMHRPNALEASLVTAYKETLGRLIHAFKPNVSPSTFLLDLQGRCNKGATPEAMSQSFFSGLDETSQFVPLAKAVRLAQPELAACFAARYEAYKRKVVWPVMKTLSECHSLILLVDVTMLLAGGVGMYNDNRQLIVDLLKVVQPGGAFHHQVLRWVRSVFPHRWRAGGITRMAFVAPKMDQVGMIDRTYMPELLKQMLQKVAGDFFNVEFGFFNCSAIMSTQASEHSNDARWLYGMPLYGQDGKHLPRGTKQRYRVSTLPAHWPQQWNIGEHSFPDVYPLMPAKHDCPPEQSYLDDIFRFVTASK